MTEVGLLSRLLLLCLALATQHAAAATTVHRVRYGYFTEARPPHAACARGWFDLYLEEPDVYYRVECYPQSSGKIAASRLDNLQLDIANLGSTPWAQAAARGVDAKVVYISQYQGDAQGIFVRPSEGEYQQITTPFDLRGRTIATPFGSTMHYQILFLLKLFDLSGVNVVDKSPLQIMNEWDDPKRDPPKIDAAGIWGTAKEYILSDTSNSKAAIRLMSARVLSDWGRPTFVVVAATRTFARGHDQFLQHFVGMLSKLNDSFLDRLGSVDVNNIPRWDASQAPGTSLVPSMVDALMKSAQLLGEPTSEELFAQRKNLELFVQQSALQQVSCDYLGPRPGHCTSPTLQHTATRQTAEFLVDQKILAQLGPLDKLSDDDGGCKSTDSLCGGDIFDGSLLSRAIEPCLGPNACLPVGRYSNITPPVQMDVNERDYLLRELERLDNVTERSPFALNEIGRTPSGDSVCINSTVLGGATNAAPASGQFGDGANAIEGKSYEENIRCQWVILSAKCDDDISSDDCSNGIVEVKFDTFRLWSGDFVYVHRYASIAECISGSGTRVLLGKMTGFHDVTNATTSLPAFRGRGCITVTFQSDNAQEKLYSGTNGDGFVATYNRDVVGCQSSIDDCNGNPCINSICECRGASWGADCSEVHTCYGTNTIRLISASGGGVQRIKSSAALDPQVLRESVIQTATPVDPSVAYANDLDCTFMLVSDDPSSIIRVDISYDLEPTYDLIWLQTGSPETNNVDPYMVLTGIHSPIARSETYYLPTDDNGIASLHFQSDSQGRRRGFVATVQATLDLQAQKEVCEVEGSSGLKCEIPHCSFSSPLLPVKSDVASEYTVGRVLSQTEAYGKVRAMPWADDGGCKWIIEGQDLPDDTVAARFVFHKPLDLEPHPATDVDDKLVIGNSQSEEMYFVEACTVDEVCSFPWQTGVCNDDGACVVNDIIELGLTNTTDTSRVEVSLVTDRNDNRTHKGLDFDIILVAECPTERGKLHCESDDAGQCVDGFCICTGLIPCSCPCDTERQVFNESKIPVALILGIVIPSVLLFLILFFLYRHKKRLKSRELKRQIGDLDAELKKFKDSVVGMKAVVKSYIPQRSPCHGENPSQPVVIEKAIWCWNETQANMQHHNPRYIYGDIANCWIKYGESSNIELEKSFQEGKATCSPMPGYEVDFKEMMQYNSQSNNSRPVMRHVEMVEVAPQVEEADLSDVLVGDGNIPADIRGEPQMVLVCGDIIQISKTSSDGEWAFGTKLHHADDTLARNLLYTAVHGLPGENNIYTDTGWFPVNQTTQSPSSKDLTALQSNVGNTDVLAPPAYWDNVNDPTTAERFQLTPADAEAQKVAEEFFSTLRPPGFRHGVEIVSVERIQNLAMWQSYVVKRQTMCHREIQSSGVMEQSNPELLMRQAVERFERCWLWHSTNVESIEKILQQGFNRSFCGKNATMYGKGVYFARDASYSAHQAYAVADDRGVRYMIACRVMVGEYCLGRLDALTPDTRDADKNLLFDSTVGLRTGDIMNNPSIYVTYHDAQAYPEYLIAFKYLNDGTNDIV